MISIRGGDKDFVPPTMNASDLSDFQEAFHKEEGYIWSWGCNFTPVVDSILKKIEGNRKNYKASGVADNAVFTFSRSDYTNFTQVEVDYLKTKLMGS